MRVGDGTAIVSWFECRGFGSRSKGRKLEGWSLAGLPEVNTGGVEVPGERALNWYPCAKLALAEAEKDEGSEYVRSMMLAIIGLAKGLVL